MNIQRRVYKFSETKQEIQQRISRLDENSNLTGNWKDENIFVLKSKNPFALFRLQCNTDETEEKGKLKVDITADYKYLLLHLVPFSFTIYGVWKATKSLQQGMLIIFLGVFIIVPTELTFTAPSVSDFTMGNLESSVSFFGTAAKKLPSNLIE